MIPQLRAWHEEYGRDGLTIIIPARNDAEALSRALDYPCTLVRPPGAWGPPT